MNNFLDVLTQILTAICKAFEWWVDSGLMEDTVTALVNIVKYSCAILVPLFWEYYNELHKVG